MELVSVHFPKAAGTSLARSLRDHFGAALHLDYDHDPVNPDHRLSDPPQLGGHVRAVHGHFRGDRYRSFTEAFTLTFLRDPVENLISIYYFWRTFPAHSSAVHDRFLAEQPTIEQFAQTYWPLRRLMSLSYFGGVDIRSFDFVGFHDSRASDLARLSAELNMPLPPDVRENPTPDDPSRSALLTDAGQLGSLRSILADDVAFYDRAQDHWRR